jgi:hypothetical protein
MRVSTSNDQSQDVRPGRDRASKSAPGDINQASSSERWADWAADDWAAA